MKITFRILSGAGGMVQGYTSAQFSTMLKAWQEKYGNCFTITSDGYSRTLEFTDDRDAIIFIQTFKPERSHWWNNAKIER